MANSVGSVAKSSLRLCFTLVNVTTPRAPRTPLPTKLAVAENTRLNLFLGSITPIIAERKAFLVTQRFGLPGMSPVGGWPTSSVRGHASRLSVGAPLLSPALGDGAGTIFTRGLQARPPRREPSPARAGCGSVGGRRCDRLGSRKHRQ